VLQTALCERLGIAYPVVQAPIGNVCTLELAAAVASAGGLGMVPAGLYQPTEILAVVERIAEMTRGPVGFTLNIRRDQSERLNACLDAGVRVVHLFWGDPRPYVTACKTAGALLMATVGSVEEAKRLADGGVDVVVAQGWEAGGHVWGHVATLPLVPAVVDAVSPLPVIAAGGIGDGRGIAAVLVLGAQAAWLGTRFVMAAEAATHPIYARSLSHATGTETYYSKLFDVGWPDAPTRVLRNSLIESWERAGSPPSGRRPGEGEVIAQAGSTEYVRYGTGSPARAMTGDVEALAMYAGQSAGLIDGVCPAREIIARLVAEAEAALRR
jgi:nitronate monooxygenase